jgi:hypothetical protein
MPLLFVMHGLLLRAGADVIHSGLLLMQASVVAAALALGFALRAFGIPARLAAPLAGTVWCTVIFQQYCTELRADYLAAALVVAAIGLASGGATRGRGLWLAAAALACVLAGLTKVTAAAVAAPIAAWLWMNGSRGLAWRFAAGTAAAWAGAMGIVQLTSRGRFLDSFFATASGGMTLADAWSAWPHFIREVASDPLVGVPFVLAGWCTAVAARRRRLSLAHLWLITAVIVTAGIFASPGTVANQLVDVHLASVLVIGIALTRAELSPRTAASVYALLAVVMAAISWPAPGIPSVIGTLRAGGPHSRAGIEAIHAEFLPPGTRYVTNDPIIAVLGDERTVLLDDFSLELSMRRGAAAGRDFDARVRRQDFDVVIMRGDADVFPRDMDTGDVRFAAYTRRYWAGWRGHREMAALLEPAYAVHAVRRPYVILTPRKNPER